MNEIISCILSGHNEITLEISRKRKLTNYTSTWQLNKVLFNHQWVIAEICK
jgi:hypothetical protein